MKSNFQLKYIITPFIFIVLTAASVYFYYAEQSRYQALEKQIGFAVEDFRSYLQDPSKAPSENELKDISQHKNNLQDILSQLVYTYKSMASQNPLLNPLEFKEKLTIRISRNWFKNQSVIRNSIPKIPLYIINR